MGVREDCDDLLAAIRELGSEENRAGMARYGINVADAAGVSIYDLRKLARPHRRDHELAAALWASGLHEARLLAAFVDDPAKVTPNQMDAWAADFDSWDLTDQACTDLFDQTPHAWAKAVEWAGRDEEWVKRGAFALIAGLAWHDKTAGDEAFVPLLALVEREASDPRNFVKKAVNWALRQIGKRDARLNAKCTELAEELASRDDKTARWIGKDALRELTSDAVRERLAKHG